MAMYEGADAGVVAWHMSSQAQIAPETVVDKALYGLKDNCMGALVNTTQRVDLELGAYLKCRWASHTAPLSTRRSNHNQ